MNELVFFRINGSYEFLVLGSKINFRKIEKNLYLGIVRWNCRL